MSDPTQPTSVSFDELEEQSKAAPPAPDLTQIKLEGEDVPELIRGKTIKEAIAQFGSLEQALKTSEQARTQVQQQPQAVATAPAVEEPKELSLEEINEIYQEDPMKALSIMQEQSARKVEKNLEARLAPLAAGTAAQVENAARAKYTDEFALFGDQITQIAGQIPNARAVLSNPAAWDDLIALVRGRPGNFDRLIEHKTRKTTEVTRQQAQRQQQETVGFSDNSGGRTPSTGGFTTLDPIQKEIASKMNMSEADYIKWSKIS